ncbi:MAG: hypothetical protein NT154_17040 [Verrucomicrobia bacterium]|nr:hypothetical protein [Verrucomicrobiota bacterium]
MKRAMLIVVVTLEFAVGALAQGTIWVENSVQPPYRWVDTDTPGNHYTGVFGIEVWALNATVVPPGINLEPSSVSGVRAYDALQANGFTLQATFAGWPMSSGIFHGRGIILPTIFSSEAVLALAVWNTSAPSWAAMLGGADANTRAGVIAFVNPVNVILVNPPAPPGLTGWTEDLVMTAIPEPSVLAVGTLGGALLLLVRRRGRRAGHTKDDPQHCITKGDYEENNT